MTIKNLVQHFGAVEDPRCRGKILHRLEEILVIAVCAVIACANSWDDIALYGRSKLAWLKTFLKLPNGIPWHDTFRRVFMLIDPDAFEAGFTAWTGSLAAGFEREVVAIDGKTLRRSFDHGREQSPLHLVSAWASEQGLVLGQRCVDGKSNWQVQRDHCHSGTAGPTCRAEQHRDVGCDGLPDRDRRADPGARRRLSADAQG